MGKQLNGRAPVRFHLLTECVKVSRRNKDRGSIPRFSISFFFINRLHKCFMLKQSLICGFSTPSFLILVTNRTIQQLLAFGCNSTKVNMTGLSHMFALIQLWASLIPNLLVLTNVNASICVGNEFNIQWNKCSLAIFYAVCAARCLLEFEISHQPPHGNKKFQT